MITILCLLVAGIDLSCEMDHGPFDPSHFVVCDGELNWETWKIVGVKVTALADAPKDRRCKPPANLQKAIEREVQGLGAGQDEVVLEIEFQRMTRGANPMLMGRTAWALAKWQVRCGAECRAKGYLFITTPAEQLQQRLEWVWMNMPEFMAKQLEMN